MKLRRFCLLLILALAVVGCEAAAGMGESQMVETPIKVETDPVGEAPPARVLEEAAPGAGTETSLEGMGEEAMAGGGAMMGNGMAGGAMAGEAMAGGSGSMEAGSDDGVAVDVSEQDLGGLRPDELEAVQLVADESGVASFLALYPDWTADTWREHETSQVVHIDFYSEAADEWLGYGSVNVATGEVIEYFVPRDLSAEEFQATRPVVEQAVLNDPEMAALLGDVSEWDYDFWYDRYDANWGGWFNRGLETYSVTVNQWDGNYYLEEIYDPNQLEEEEARMMAQDRAIELAWEATGLWEAVKDTDDWTTYVAHQGGSLYTVEFVTTDRELYYVLVDTDSWTVVDEGIGE